MKRRTVEKAVVRVRPPAWCTSLGAGAAHGVELTGSQDLRVWLPALRAARWQWCRENGCYRAGMTCEQVFGHRCDPVGGA